MLITLIEKETGKEVFINSSHIIAVKPEKDKDTNRIYSEVLLSNNGMLVVTDEPKYIQDIMNRGK